MPASIISERKLSVFLGCLLVTYASVAILFDVKFRGNQRLEQLLSHFSILDNDLLVEKAYKQLDQRDRDNLTGAVETFREALRRDPASPYHWCDLGEALLEAEQVEKARYCFSRALELGPNTAPVLLRVANFHFRVDESREALQCTYRVLTLLPDFDPVIFSSYTRMGGGIGDVLNYGLPPIARPA
jgi:tetratricopeptide (TPR) repeat protein